MTPKQTYLLNFAYIVFSLRLPFDGFVFALGTVKLDYAVKFGNTVRLDY